MTARSADHADRLASSGRAAAAASVVCSGTRPGPGSFRNAVARVTITAVAASNEDEPAPDTMSQLSNRKVRDVADCVIYTGDL